MLQYILSIFDVLFLLSRKKKKLKRKHAKKVLISAFNRIINNNYFINSELMDLLVSELDILKNALEKFPFQIWIYCNNNYIYLNEGTQKIFGYNIEEYKNDLSLWEKVIHLDDKKRVLKWGNKQFPKKYMEYRIIRKDKSIITVIDMPFKLANIDGGECGIVIEKI